VIEGSTITGRAAPNLLIFVLHPFLSPERWKPTTGPLLRRADLVVVNRESAEMRPPSEAVLSAIARDRPLSSVRIADVTRPLGEWAPEILARVPGARG
jgi:hypothetical protein